VTKEEKAKYDKEYYEKNKERKKEYYEKNKEHRKEQMKKYYENNKERKKEYNKEYFEKNKEEKAKYDKEYYEKNKERINENNKEYWKNQPAAVYKIRNIKIGTVYIGQSSTYSKRWHTHKSRLRNNRHENLQLQEDYNKYGKEAFVFEVIEELPCDTSRDVLLTKESEAIKKYLNEGKKLYNKEGG